jgi:hypothetical protein
MAKDAEEKNQAEYVVVRNVHFNYVDGVVQEKRDPELGVHAGQMTRLFPGEALNVKMSDKKIADWLNRGIIVTKEAWDKAEKEKADKAKKAQPEKVR